jgi:RNA polymerase sigma factor (sigma-70 family)
VTAVPPFQDFLEQHRAMVLRFLVAAVGRHDADDCFQETFLAALRAYPTLRDGSRLDHWILRIASRKAIDHHRRATRTPRPVEAVPEAPEPPASGVDHELLWKAIGELPPRQRLAVVHRYVLDRSYADVAESMGGTEEAARANVHQAMRKLREMIG